jgi:non-lysosomal glucosylceramidase
MMNDFHGKALLVILAILLCQSVVTKAGDNDNNPSSYAWSIPLGVSSHKAGVPLGGIGAGNFMYNACGSFGPWRMRPQDLEARYLPQAAFHLREEVDGKRPQTATLATSDVMAAWPKIAPGSATYYALFPKGWCKYGGFQATITLEFFSPIIKDNYRETSLPVGIFLFHLRNPTDKPVKLSLMFTFPNAPYVYGGDRSGLTNKVVHRGAMDAIVLTTDNPTNSAETQGSQWCMATDAKGASLQAVWDGTGDGHDILDEFARSGVLHDIPAVDTKLPCGAIAVSMTLKPGESRDVPFVLAWDFPQVSFGSGTRWWRRYTEYFPPGKPQAPEIAAEALKKFRKWSKAIDSWQSPYLAGSAPAWLKQGAMNELYYCTFGGSFWENGCITKPKKYGARPGQHLAFVMECMEYNYAESFDVRQHACRVTRDLWPQMERDILLGFADFVTDEKVNPKGAVPHDAGSPEKDPFFDFDQYGHNYIHYYHHGEWPTPWSEFSPKLIQQSFAYWKATGDKNFLKEIYPALLRTYRYQKSTDTSGDGLSELDSSEYLKNKFFNAVLWIGALECMQSIIRELGDTTMVNEVNADLKLARASTEREFWDEKLGYYKFNETNDAIMADALIGMRIPNTFGLQPLLDTNRLTSHCRQMFRRLVVPLRDFNGDGIGDMGMANCLTPDSKPAVDCTGPAQVHYNEVWVGVSVVAAANLIHQGRVMNDGALISEGLYTAWSTYERIWRDADSDRWFWTPEAWTIDNPSARRTSGPYQRARGIWETLMEANQIGSGG